MSRPRAGVAVATALALAGILAPVGSRGETLLPEINWVPNTIATVPLPNSNNQGLSWLHVTRRIVPQPPIVNTSVPVAGGQPSPRFLLGHALFGLYTSSPGVGWVPLTPQCFTLVGPNRLKDILPLLPGCGIEGIAFDPADPLGVYVSTYNINIFAVPPTVDPGGIFKSELRFGIGSRSFTVGTAGLTWTELLHGVRGNAIAVKRPTPAQKATIVVGRIQQGGSVGVDDNGVCRSAVPPAGWNKCSPSVYVSDNDGVTWSAKYFTGSGCSISNVVTSPAIVGNLAFDPQNNTVVYAGSNGGFFQSVDSGRTWAVVKPWCGHNAGFAATSGSGTQRIYIGNHLGEIWTGPTGPGGVNAATLKPLFLSEPLPLQILSVILDTRDPTERTILVAAWSGTNPNTFPNTGRGAGGVFKVIDRGDGTAEVIDLKASFLEDCAGLVSSNLCTSLNTTLRSTLLPYPLVKEPNFRASLFLAQHPLVPDLIYASTVFGGVWTRSDGDHPLVPPPP